MISFSLVGLSVATKYRQHSEKRKSEDAVNYEDEKDVNNEAEGKESVWNTVTTGMAPFTGETEMEDTSNP